MRVQLVAYFELNNFHSSGEMVLKICLYTNINDFFFSFKRTGSYRERYETHLFTYLASGSNFTKLLDLLVNISSYENVQ